MHWGSTSMVSVTNYTFHPQLWIAAFYAAEWRQCSTRMHCVCVQHSCFTALTHRFGYKHGILRHKNRCQSHIFLVKPIKWCKNWILAHFFIEIKSIFLKFRLLSFSLIFLVFFCCFLDFFFFNVKFCSFFFSVCLFFLS